MRAKPRDAFAELLIDCEEDRTLRAVLVGMLREADPGWGQRMKAPIESASVRTMATAAKTRMTFRQFGSLGGGRRVVVGSSIQENHMRREYARRGMLREAR
jgi:hypothetical protein